MAQYFLDLDSGHAGHVNQWLMFVQWPVILHVHCLHDSCEAFTNDNILRVISRLPAVTVNYKR